MGDLFIDKNIDPMLLYETEPFDSDEYIFELKLDGIRCIAYIEPKSVVLQNKRHKDVTAIYPELSELKCCVKKRVILDGELVVLTDGKPDFYALQKRSLMSDDFKIKLATNKTPVQFVAYDILYIDGKDITNKPLKERKELLSKAVTEGHGLSISRYIEKNGKAFFELAKQESLEGIVAKKKDGLYVIACFTVACVYRNERVVVYVFKLLLNQFVRTVSVAYEYVYTACCYTANMRLCELA